VNGCRRFERTQCCPSSGVKSSVGLRSIEDHVPRVTPPAHRHPWLHRCEDPNSRTCYTTRDILHAGRRLKPRPPDAALQNCCKHKLIKCLLGLFRPLCRGECIKVGHGFLISLPLQFIYSLIITVIPRLTSDPANESFG